jgi:phosphoribosylglycinamide formyltransferase-1
MADLRNLVVDLDERFAVTPHEVRALRRSIAGVELAASAAADERTLAWIDFEFGGSWSGEVHAGTNAVAFRDGAPIGFATFDPKGLRFRWLRGIASERDVGVFGPFGIAAPERGRGVGNVLLRLALIGLRERGYARALIAAVGDDRLARYYADAVGARSAERFDRAALVAPRSRAVVLASGSGSNFQAVVDGVREGRLPIDVVGLVTNNPQAPAIERARMAGIDSVRILPWMRKEEARTAYDARLLEEVAAFQPELVLLLGWMHLLDESFVRTFPNLINVHPAYLPLDPERDEVALPDGTTMPAFRGVHAVRDAVASGHGWIGASVHFVTPATDRGPVLARKPMRTVTGEDETQTLQRLHPIEHQLVAGAIMRWLYERE